MPGRGGAKALKIHCTFSKSISNCDLPERRDLASVAAEVSGVRQPSKCHSELFAAAQPPRDQEGSSRVIHACSRCPRPYDARGRGARGLRRPPPRRRPRERSDRDTRSKRKKRSPKRPPRGRLSARRSRSRPSRTPPARRPRKARNLRRRAGKAPRARGADGQRRPSLGTTGRSERDERREETRRAKRREY